MGSDIAVAGHFAFARKISFESFSRDAEAGDLLPPEDFQFATTRFDVPKRRVVIEIHCDRSAYRSDVEPLVEDLLALASRSSARGEIVEIDLSGEGRRFRIEQRRVKESRITEDEVRDLWDSELFASVRRRLDKTLDAARGDDESDLEVPVTTIAEARRALQRRLAFAGEEDGVEPARKLLDGDASPEAVDLVIDAIERKWIFPSPMSGEDEALVKAVLLHHDHPRLIEVVEKRLASLRASGRSDIACRRVIEGLSYVLKKRPAKGS